jgi:hypothetical protein
MKLTFAMMALAFAFIILSVSPIGIFAFSAAPSFQASHNISNDAGKAQFPSIANVRSNVYVAWTEQSRGVYFSMSSNDGVSWSTGLKLSLAGGTADYPIITAMGSEIYVVWSQSTASGKPMQVYFSASSDNGALFSTPVIIDNTPTTSSLTPVIASSGSNIVVGWIASTHSYVRTSTNNGATWGSVLSLASNHEPEVAISGNNIYAVSDGGHFAISHDAGSTWVIKSIGTDSEPWIAASGSNVYAAWETKSTSSKIYVLVSNDNGNTFTTKVLTTTLPNSWNPMVAAFGSKAYVAIQEYPGVTKANIWIYVSSNSGASWNAPVSLSGSGSVLSYPFEVATSDGQNVYVMWGQQLSSTTWVSRISYSGDGGSSWSTAPGIDVSNNPSGSAATNNDIATGAIASDGTHGLSVWQYVSGTTSQIYFSGS